MFENTMITRAAVAHALTGLRSIQHPGDRPAALRRQLGEGLLLLEAFPEAALHLHALEYGVGDSMKNLTALKNAAERLEPKILGVVPEEAGIMLYDFLRRLCNPGDEIFHGCMMGLDLAAETSEFSPHDNPLLFGCYVVFSDGGLGMAAWDDRIGPDVLRFPLNLECLVRRNDTPDRSELLQKVLVLPGAATAAQDMWPYLVGLSGTRPIPGEARLQVQYGTEYHKAEAVFGIAPPSLENLVELFSFMAPGRLGPMWVSQDEVLVARAHWQDGGRRSVLGASCVSDAEMGGWRLQRWCLTGIGETRTGIIDSQRGNFFLGAGHVYEIMGGDQKRVEGVALWKHVANVERARRFLEGDTASFADLTDVKPQRVNDQEMILTGPVEQFRLPSELLASLQGRGALYRIQVSFGGRNAAGIERRWSLQVGLDGVSGFPVFQCNALSVHRGNKEKMGSYLRTLNLQNGVDFS